MEGYRGGGRRGDGKGLKGGHGRGLSTGSVHFGRKREQYGHQRAVNKSGGSVGRHQPPPSMGASALHLRRQGLASPALGNPTDLHGMYQLDFDFSCFPLHQDAKASSIQPKTSVSQGKAWPAGHNA